MFMVPTEGFCSNSLIPNDLSGALRDSFVLPGQFPHVKRVRVGGVFSSHQAKRAPHLLQADAVATFKRMRMAEPLPLSVFLSTSLREDSSVSDHAAPYVHPLHTQTGAAVFSSTAASSHSAVQNVSSARSQSSPVTKASDIYNG